jgi:hypothetical protein
MRFTFSLLCNVADCTLPVRSIDGSLRRLAPATTEHTRRPIPYPLLHGGRQAGST